MDISLHLPKVLQEQWFVLKYVILRLNKLRVNLVKRRWNNTMPYNNYDFISLIAMVKLTTSIIGYISSTKSHTTVTDTAQITSSRVHQLDCKKELCSMIGLQCNYFSTFSFKVTVDYSICYLQEQELHIYTVVLAEWHLMTLQHFGFINLSIYGQSKY